MCVSRSLCFIILILTLSTVATSCKKQGNQRYISESDTTYSPDVRNISKKINDDPNNAELYYRRSNTFFFEDNFKQALLDIDFALVLDSVNPLYHYNRAKYLMSGDTANAIDAEISYKKAIKYKPDFIDAMNDLAHLYLAKQKYQESEELYTKVNKLDPSNVNSYFYMGMIAKETGDTFKAVKLFEKALTYDDKHFNSIMQLGNLYAIKQDKQALVFFDRAIKINEFSDEAYYAKGLFLQKEGKFKDATALYETVARMNPGHILCRYNLGFINGMFGNYEKAISYLDQVVELSPEYADAYTLRGAMKEKIKNSTGAYNDYKLALQLDPNQKLAEEGLKRINITISMP